MQVAATALGGRDFEGQVTKEINGKTYILIGNEQQLRAIGSGKKVIGRINKVTQTCTGQGLFGYHWVDGASSTEYAGDADLADSDTLRNADASDYDNSLAICHTKVDADKTRTRYYGVGADGTQADYSAANTGLTYSADANYLIFRDIDLSKNAADTASTEWTPLMFSGTMLGAVSNSADAVASLWKAVGADGASVEHTTAARPVISMWSSINRASSWTSASSRHRLLRLDHEQDRDEQHQSGQRRYGRGVEPQAAGRVCDESGKQVIYSADTARHTHFGSGWTFGSSA